MILQLDGAAVTYRPHELVALVKGANVARVLVVLHDVVMVASPGDGGHGAPGRSPDDRQPSQGSARDRLHGAHPSCVVDLSKPGVWILPQK